MKPLLSLTVTLSMLAAFTVPAVADIQAPAMIQQDPLRKLGRGISNIAFGVTELPYQVGVANDTEGNSALGVGLVLGVHRSVVRISRGVFDVATFPFPIYKSSYRPPFPSALVWGYNGYTEFPPEIGFESRYHYSRTYSGSN